MTLDVDARASVQGFAVSARFRAPAGITTLRGPSASGKSLCLRLVAGLLRATDGHVRFGDTVWDAPPDGYLPPERREIGYAPQHGALWPHRTVRQQLNVVAPGFALDATLLALGVGALLDRVPSALSGGERQRVALVRALLRRPKLLLLDEPWTAIDTDARGDIMATVKRWVRDHGCVALLVTHDTDDVRALADREIHASAGVIREPSIPRP